MTIPVRQRAVAVAALAAALVLFAVGSGHPGRVDMQVGAAAVAASSDHEHGMPSAEHAADNHHPDAPGGHAGTEGLTLAPSTELDTLAGGSCPGSAPEVVFSVVALNVEITLNRYLDYDPDGRMFALASEVPRVRAEEAANAAARETGDPPAVSLGLQGDAIQPLTLRAHPGDCVRLELTNDLAGELASIHIHGAALRLAGTDKPALATDPGSYAQPGGSIAYEWWIPPNAPEGTHYLHSHGRTRFQTGHGLFGAVIVEPPGTSWTDPRSGASATGWDAIVRGGSADFREFVVYYHEIGDENTRLLDASGEYVPVVDPITSAYRPAARALNYRSEPFYNRLALQQARTGDLVSSLPYSSYTFGDPATPILRAYLGDPVKQRLVHAGAEVFHVHHVHGGSIRWRRQPGEEPVAYDTGLDKQPRLLPETSERIDSQGIGPAETFDIENECGAGGCQQAAGDYLYHCHVGHHYFAGMWGLWRVYNTLQNGPASTDDMAPLAALPDRASAVVAGVTSAGLVGRPVARLEPDPIAPEELSAWVEPQLPPPGAPGERDASVMDWVRTGDVYRGPPEEDASWPGYRPRAPGIRPPLLFDPTTGKLAYPSLRPQLGARPPFAPNHGPAPFLDPFADGPDPPAPGASGPASVCPDGTQLRQYEIHAIEVPLALNERMRLIDPNGALFALKEDIAALREAPSKREPLTLRANAGRDCVDVLLASELTDGPRNHGHSKVSLHIHFAQFDVQASDGIDAGFNYEQTVRPFAQEGTRLTAEARAGASSLAVADAARFRVGVLVAVGLDADAQTEVRSVVGAGPTRLELDSPLESDHAVGEAVSVEFVRYRWYPDVQFGTAYFHDHVNALESWRHGLFGALVGEPPDATFHDPETGAEIVTGARADIHTSAPVSADVRGSFRELVIYLQDDIPLTAARRSTGGALNLRAEPLFGRGDDPARVFSGLELADFSTPVLESYLGDPIVLRTLVAGTNELHTLHVDGHWMRFEPFSPASAPVSTVHLGISERVDAFIPAAGGPQRLPGDYMFRNGRPSKLTEGSWGLLRVHEQGASASLRPLPDVVPEAPAERVCPVGAPVRHFAVTALEVPLPMLGRKPGLVYVLNADVEATLDATRAPEPLVLRARVGDCLEIELTNRTETSVSLHADMLAYDPSSSAGIAAGREPPQLAPPGGSYAYTFYAHPDVGETAALLSDGADSTSGPANGLYGAVIVGPADAEFLDSETGRPLDGAASWRATIRTGATRYRDFALFLHDEDTSIGTHRMPYTTRVDGAVGINYRLAPFRDGETPFTVTDALPDTPLLQAVAGDAVRVHVLAPWSEQAQVFAIEGHNWELEPGTPGTSRVSALQIGGLEAVTLHIESAGGPERLPGDYLYGNHREPYRQAGQWGVFRVLPAEELQVDPEGRPQAQGALDRAIDSTSCPAGVLCGVFGLGLGGWSIGLAALALGFVALLRRLRRAKA